MKLIKRTANILTMRHLPWGEWLIGGLLICLGIIFLSNAELITISCTRDLQQPTQGQCTLSKSNWLGQVQSQRSLQLQQITGASFFPVGSSKGGTIYQIYLNTAKEPVPSSIKSTYEKHLQSEVARIQTFLKNDLQSQLTLWEDDRFPMYFMCMVMVTIAVGINILLGGISTLSLNKITKKLTLKKQGGLGTYIFECDLNQIDRVIASSKFLLSEYHMVVIVLKAGTALQQTNVRQVLFSLFFRGIVGSVLILRLPSLFFSRKSEYELCAKQILDFLHAGGYLKKNDVEK
ncbi:hypothetical protein V2H45_24820 [Tumidithrix elongata RA019]|uniref:Uncharacterized protein n=1 Tax=Tumidithrix elongata BACA0141 TaxID=2716417 RepID=A0AAW9PWP8_9CYAN|nr:hypothetical protein [Tumidithrix elongata RA019]